MKKILFLVTFFILAPTLVYSKNIDRKIIDLKVCVHKLDSGNKHGLGSNAPMTTRKHCLAGEEDLTYIYKNTIIRELKKGVKQLCHYPNIDYVVFFERTESIGYCNNKIYKTGREVFYDGRNFFYNAINPISTNTVASKASKDNKIKLAKKPEQPEKKKNIVQLCIAVDNDGYFRLRNKILYKNCFSDLIHLGSAVKVKELSYKELLAENPYTNLCYRPNYQSVFAVKTMNYSYANGWVKLIDGELKNTNKECNQVFKDAFVLNHQGEDFFSYGQNIKAPKVQIAKKTPKPEKKFELLKKSEKKEKKKVAKVVEREQQEIKVKTKNKDTTGPVIEIAEAITVDDSSYTLKGKVTDKGSDKIYLKVDGEDFPIKRGKFKIERYSPVDEELEIIAIDKWGNKSTKVVKVTIDIKEETVVQKLEPLNPGRAKGKTSGEKVALIIGIENYTEAPKANYANLDAKYFFDYARKAFGAKKQNINLMINEDATFVKTNKALTLWLRTKVKADQTDLIIFFAGHGLASNDGKELYILPQDSDPNLLDITALSRTKLFQTIINLKPKSVTMFLDTCYSGVSRDEKMLLASARPIRIVSADEGEIPNNFTIFSASGLDQISSGFEEAKHGIFSYYLMKGLEGKADANKNKEITNGELLAYMDQNISQKALEQGRQQNPSLTGDPDQVLVRY